MDNLIENTELELIKFKQDGSIIEVSTTFYSILGLENSDKINFWELSDIGYKQYEINQLMANYLYIKSCKHKNGSRVPCYIKCLSYDEKMDEVCCILWPVKSKLDVESITTYRGQLLLELNKNDVFDSGNFKEAVNIITEAATKGLSTARGSVWFFNETKDKLILFDLFEADKNNHSREYEINSADFPVYFKCLKEDKAILADNAHTHPGTKEFSSSYLTPLGINSMLHRCPGFTFKSNKTS
ncbi:MAG: hypothetical protein NE328_01130 [Lentisphaeraceae bacterium]|nr:hypothetical protein [Lentisphaeraceae bacterium]